MKIVMIHTSNEADVIPISVIISALYNHAIGPMPISKNARNNNVNNLIPVEKSCIAQIPNASKDIPIPICP